MIDIERTIREHLVQIPRLVALTDSRIYAATETPPAGYSPSDGAALCHKVRGGLPDYPDGLYNPSVQFRAFAESEIDAFTLDRALFDSLQSTGGAKVRWGRCEMLGQLVRTAAGWPTVLSAYVLVVMDTDT